MVVPFGPSGSTIGSLGLSDTSTLQVVTPTPQGTPYVLPNPALNFRFSVRLRPPNSTTWYIVPGFFAGSEQLPNSTNGDIGPGSTWRFRFTPDERHGFWEYQAILETGNHPTVPGFDNANPPMPINVSSLPVPANPVGAPGVVWYSPVISIKTHPYNPLAPGFHGLGFIRANAPTGTSRYLCFSNPLLPEAKRHFLKVGVNSPENFFGYSEFYKSMKDNRFTMNPQATWSLLSIWTGGPGTGRWHDYDRPIAGNPPGAPASTHRQDDWNPGDPEWVTTRRVLDAGMSPPTITDEYLNALTGMAGHGIIGAINYLSEQGMNSIYVEPMNLAGDGCDTYPFASVDIADLQFARSQPANPSDVFSYSIKRLQEWNIVAEHAMKKGLLVHFQLHETESNNQGWLGYDVTLNTSPLSISYTRLAAATNQGEEVPRNGMTHARRLYLKQMVAHFGHLLGVQWNLGEEVYARLATTPGPNAEPVDFSLAQLAAMAGWIESWDGYHDHPIAVHGHGWNILELFTDIVAPGQPEWLDVTSAYIYGQEPRDYTVAPSGTAAFADEPHLYDKQTEDLRASLAASGSKGARVVVSVDEQGNWRYGAAGETADPGALFKSPTVMSSPEGRRRLVLYDVLFSGGSLEWYCGFGMSLDQWTDTYDYETPWPPGPSAPTYSTNPMWMTFGGGDVSIEEFYSREKLWQASSSARRILELMPYWLAVPDDTRVSGDPHSGSGTPGPNAPSNGGAYGPIGTYGRAQVLACPDGATCFAFVYYPTAYNGTTPLALGNLSMPDRGDAGYAGQFYNPMTGNAVGSVFYFNPTGGQQAIVAPAASGWPDPMHPGPDVVLLINGL